VSLTYGDAGDIEARCAAAVASDLELAHRRTPMEVRQPEGFTDLHLRSLHCSTGFTLVPYWSWLDPLREMSPLFAMAFATDFIVGGSHADWAYDRAEGAASFSRLFERNNQYGIDIDTVKRLLRPGVFDSAIPTVTESLRHIYNAYGGHGSQRAWWFDLHHRVRHYTGTFPWQLSFASWPVLPSIDRELLAVTGGIPPGVLSDRRVQDEILRRWFPRLAALPLDRNSFDSSPISPSLAYRLMQPVARQFDPLVRAGRRLRYGRRERRIYYRTFDINSPTWVAIRKKAEPHRDRLRDIFDHATLDSLLRPATEHVPHDGIADTFGQKLLLGLCLWASKYL
jgi:asparagine synthase (glutamine-hydrolysing)